MSVRFDLEQVRVVKVAYEADLMRKARAGIKSSGILVHVYK